MTTNHITQAMANPEIIAELGRRFKEYRLTYRLTQKEVAEKAYGLPIDPVHELIQDCRGDKIPNKYCSFTSGDATRPPPFRATALTAVFTYFIVCPKLWVSLLSGSYPSFWQTKS